MIIHDPMLYEELCNNFRLENPDMDYVQQEIDIDLQMDEDIGLEVVIFICPFEEATDCEYTLTEFIRTEDELYMVRNACAAHIVTAHTA